MDLYSSAIKASLKPKLNQILQKFTDSLPAEFSHQGYLDTAHCLDIPEKTAEYYISDLLKDGKIEKIAQGKYKEMLKYAGN